MKSKICDLVLQSGFKTVKTNIYKDAFLIQLVSIHSQHLFWNAEPPELVCWSFPNTLHFSYGHSAELLLNLRSDPATCYLYSSPSDSPLHYFPCGQGLCCAPTAATLLQREIHESHVSSKKEGKKKSAPVLTHLLKTEWSAKFVWEGFWRCPAALSVQHMLQALASPIAFQVIGQAQQGVGF